MFFCLKNSSCLLFLFSFKIIIVTFNSFYTYYDQVDNLTREGLDIDTSDFWKSFDPSFFFSMSKMHVSGIICQQMH